MGAVCNCVSGMNHYTLILGKPTFTCMCIEKMAEHIPNRFTNTLKSKNIIILVIKIDSNIFECFLYTFFLIELNFLGSVLFTSLLQEKKSYFLFQYF